MNSLRIGHLTTVDMSLWLLLRTELVAQREAGHTLFGLSAPGPYAEHLGGIGVRHVPLPALTRHWSLVADARAFAQVCRALRALDLDVLHTHNPKTGVLGRIAGRICRIPVVVNTCHGLYAQSGDPIVKRAAVYGLESLAIQFSDFEFFQNADDAATLRWALRPGRHRVVGNGIDLRRFVPDPAAGRRLRREWGIGVDDLVVGAVGRRVPEKGLREFAAVAGALSDRARFVWVGPQEGADSPPGGASVLFTGERTDMPAVYAAFDMFVLPSYREGLSRAAMEAAACGLPMVLSDIRGCREIGRDGEDLRLVPPGDAGALASAVADLLADPAARADLGAAAQTRARAEFDQRRIARESLATYASVARAKGIDRPPRPDTAVTVVHVLPEDSHRGAQTFAAQLRDALATDPEQRHLTLALFAGPAASLRPDLALGRRSGVARRVGLDPLAVLRLRRALRRVGADVVVAHGGEPLKYVVAARPRAASAYLKIGLSAAELSRPARRSVYRRLAGRVDRVVAVSTTVGDQVHAVLRVPRRRIRVIPNGRDPQTFRPREQERREGPIGLIFVGQLEAGKQPGLFIDAVAALRARGHPVRATIAGDGPMRSRIAGPARAAGVDLLGLRQDVPALLRGHDILVMTSAADTEGMPGALVEAGLSGLPVVTTEAAGVRDVVLDQVTGFVTAPHPEALADALATLVVDAERRTEMGARARAHCVATFSIQASASTWRGLVAELSDGVAAVLRPGPVGAPERR